MDTKLPGDDAVRDFYLYVIDARNLLELAVSSADFVLHVNGVMRETWANVSEQDANDHDAGSVGSMAKLARSEVDNGFPLLYAHNLVGLWGAFEACIGAIGASWLAASTPGDWGDALSNLRIRIGEWMAVEESARSEWLMDQIERAVSSDLKAGVGQFESVLTAIGLGGAADSNVTTTLFYAKAMRNVVAHQGGRADNVFVDRCGRLNVEVGQRLQISREQITAIHTAMVLYSESVLDRIRLARGLPSAPPALPPWITETSDLLTLLLPGGTSEPLA
ncbi:hypothetical protein ACDF64_02025 [Agromyces sp. MMS24-JH15]|uniref:hypothetical protein n=1 Tax=Agromyces sp. MMS24-JH15 TaxID=3243765 RepID=UPI00374A3AF4